MGFCLFNNVAIAAAEARAVLGCERVLIVDWDVHHGNGTQQAFFDRRDVLFFSIHQVPLYPGTGWLDEVGEGAGLGHTVNVPLPPGCGDAEYEAALQELLRPIADAYRPDLVLVSAGFDAHRDDPLANMEVSDRGFAAMTQVVRDIATRHAGGRLVLVLEGGYDLDSLGRNVRQTVDMLTGARVGAPSGLEAAPNASHGATALKPPDAVSAQARAILERVRAQHQRFWPL
jgi:acetoin utilization deacetylase AcuC-like enzyme